MLIVIHELIHELLRSGAVRASSTAGHGVVRPGRRACPGPHADYGSEGWGFESLGRAPSILALTSTNGRGSMTFTVTPLDLWPPLRRASGLDRITSGPAICHGRPTAEEILEDYPDLEGDDLLAALEELRVDQEPTRRRAEPRTWTSWATVGDSAVVWTRVPLSVPTAVPTTLSFAVIDRGSVTCPCGGEGGQPGVEG